MSKSSVFSLVSFLCAAYVFLGIAPWVYLLYYGRLVGLVFFALWIGNFFLLGYANKQW